MRRYRRRAGRTKAIRERRSRATRVQDHIPEVLYQAKMTPQGAYYMNHSRARVTGSGTRPTAT